jgi:hypothetical protein
MGVRAARVRAAIREETPMTIDNAVAMFAGFMILLSVALTWFVSPWFLLLTGFVGVNLIQASITGFCPAAIVFKALGLKTGAMFS